MRLPGAATVRRYFGSVAVAAIGLFLMAAIIATGPEAQSEGESGSVPVVTVVEAQPGTIRLTVDAHGVVVPKTESRLVPEVSGRIVSVAESMVSGGFFRRGDVLVAIDRVDYVLALEQARARLASAQSELVNSGRAFDREKQLTETDAASESRKDEAENRWVVATANVREAKALLARAERDFKRTELLAPYDGRVRSEAVDPGQFVSRGETLAHLYSVDFAEVRLPVHDDDLAFLPVSLDGALADAMGPEVVLRARFAGREHAWEGRIVRTEGEIDPGTRMVKMVAQVPRPYGQPEGRPPLTVGLFVAAEIQGHEVADVSTLPRTALQAGGHVHIVDENGLLRVREAELLREVGEQVHVKGLVSGERVSVTRLPGAAEGLRVRPVAAGDTAEPAQ